jgi:hypothetical protein
MMVDPNAAISAQSQNNQMAYNVQQAGYNAEAAASNYNRMLLAGAVTNAANFAAAGMGQGAQSKVGGTPMPSQSMAPGTSPLAKGPSYASAAFPIRFKP